MSPAWMRPFPRHLGRVRSIQIAVAGYPCLDECHEGTAAGIYAIRRLKFKRCGGLVLRLSSRLTFAYVYVVVREIHLGRPMPSEAVVDGVPCLDVVIFGTSSQGKGNTDSYGGASLHR